MFYRRSQSTQSCSGAENQTRPGAGEFPASIHSFGSCAESVSYWSWSPCRTSRRSGSTKCNRRRVATKSATKCVLRALPTLRRLHFVPHFVGYTSSNCRILISKPWRPSRPSVKLPLPSGAVPRRAHIHHIYSAIEELFIIYIACRTTYWSYIVQYSASIQPYQRLSAHD